LSWFIKSARSASNAIRNRITCTNRSIRDEHLFKSISEQLGLPWNSVEEFDAKVLTDNVEKIIVKPDGVEVVVKVHEMLENNLATSEPSSSITSYLEITIIISDSYFKISLHIEISMVL